MEEMRRVSLSMFSDKDLQRVHDYSMKLLAENGAPDLCNAYG